MNKRGLVLAISIILVTLTTVSVKATTIEVLTNKKSDVEHEFIDSDFFNQAVLVEHKAGKYVFRKSEKLPSLFDRQSIGSGLIETGTLVESTLVVIPFTNEDTSNVVTPLVIVDPEDTYPVTYSQYREAWDSSVTVKVYTTVFWPVSTFVECLTKMSLYSKLTIYAEIPPSFIRR